MLLLGVCFVLYFIKLSAGKDFILNMFSKYSKTHIEIQHV